MYKGTHAASKRSIELVVDTLCLEVEPLGLNVPCVVTGGVKSAGQTYFDNLKVPDTSFYKSVETVISKARGHDGMPRMDALGYANAVVDEVEKRISGRFGCGQNADMVKHATTAVAVPQEAFVRLVSELYLPIELTR